MLLNFLFYIYFIMSTHETKTIHVFVLILQSDVQNSCQSSFASMDAFWLNLLKPVKHKSHHEVNIFLNL